MTAPPTAEMLSDWLRRSGTLPFGSITHTALELELETSVSKLFFVTVKYSTAVPHDLPPQVLVKSSKNRLHEDDEVVFYRKLAPLVGSPPSVRCLAAIERGDSEPATLVIEDLRCTHDHPPWPIPPT